MIANHKFGACLPTFGNCADRYCLGGYGGGARTMAGMLDSALEVKGLDGLELVGNWHVNDRNIRKVARMFSDRGLMIPMLVPDLWTQAKWGRGSLAAPDARTRRAAVREVQKVMDWAAELGCPYVDVWPGQDGFDYGFQADYPAAWEWLREGLFACAGHSDKVKVLVEYKPREPRTHCFVDHVGTVLFLLRDLDRVGVLLDAGHAMQGAENVACSAALLAHHGKLDYVHLNDNHGDWDEDMMAGSVHLVGLLELTYWLLRVGYKGWLTLDIFPYREDGVRAAIECREWMEAMFRAVKRAGMDAIAEVIGKADACEASAMVRRALGMQGACGVGEPRVTGGRRRRKPRRRSPG